MARNRKVEEVIMNSLRNLVFVGLVVASGSPLKAMDHESSSASEKVEGLTNKFAQILEECLVPQALQEKLDALFQTSDFQTFLVNHKKRILLGNVRYRMAANVSVAEAKKQLLMITTQQYNHEIEIPETSFAQFCTTYNIQDLAFKVQRKGQIYALVSDLWDGYVLKVPRCRWIDNDDMIPSKYQNISRVFYNKKIRDFAKANNLKHIHPIRKYLYHIPGKPFDLNDDNYLIVADRVDNFPSIEQNLKLLENLLDSQELSKGEIVFSNESGDVMQEMLQIITYAGIWDIKMHNVFFTLHDESLKTLFLDTEKPGLGGGSDNNFFHANYDEFIRNCACGIDELGGILKSLIKNRVQ